MRENKELGLDVSKPRDSIDQEDMNKLFEQYFKPGIERKDTHVLLQKVFFDIVYYTGRRAKEGLHQLDKKSFEVKTGSDDMEYIEITFNEKTKKNQGADTSTSSRALHDNHHIISALPGNTLCPVESFKTYISLLNHNETAFFQYPNKDRKGYKNSPVGKNSLANMMKQISKDAKLSKKYTNHCIRKTTVTAMKRQGFDLNKISHVTKHKNLDSLKHYIGGPTYADQKKYNEAMSHYASNDYNPEAPPQKKQILDVPPKTPEIKIAEDASLPNKPNITPEQCLILRFPPEESNSNEGYDPNSVMAMQSQKNVVNQMQSASHLFQNTNFNNCTFTFQMPK